MFNGVIAVAGTQIVFLPIISTPEQLRILAPEIVPPSMVEPLIAAPEIVPALIAVPEIVPPVIVAPEIAVPEIVPPLYVAPEIVAPDTVPPLIVAAEIVVPEIVPPLMVEPVIIQAVSVTPEIVTTPPAEVTNPLSPPLAGASVPLTEPVNEIFGPSPADDPSWLWPETILNAA